MGLAITPIMDIKPVTKTEQVEDWDIVFEGGQGALVTIRPATVVTHDRGITTVTDANGRITLINISKVLYIVKGKRMELVTDSARAIPQKLADVVNGFQ